MTEKIKKIWLDWQSDLLKLISSVIGTHDPFKLQKAMILILQKCRKYAEKYIEKSNAKRMKMLCNTLRRFLAHFHFRAACLGKAMTKPSYEEIGAAILSIILNLEVSIVVQSRGLSGQSMRRLIRDFHIYLGHTPCHMWKSILWSSKFCYKHKFLNILYERVLGAVPAKIKSPKSYMMFLLVLRMWKKNTDSKEAKKIVSLARTAKFSSKKFSRWLHSLPTQLPLSLPTVLNEKVLVKKVIHGKIDRSEFQQICDLAIQDMTSSSYEDDNSDKIDDFPNGISYFNTELTETVEPFTESLTVSKLHEKLNDALSSVQPFSSSSPACSEEANKMAKRSKKRTISSDATHDSRPLKKKKRNKEELTKRNTSLEVLASRNHQDCNVSEKVSLEMSRVVDGKISSHDKVNRYLEDLQERNNGSADVSQSCNGNSSGLIEDGLDMPQNDERSPTKKRQDVRKRNKSKKMHRNGLTESNMIYDEVHLHSPKESNDLGELGLPSSKRKGKMSKLSDELKNIQENHHKLDRSKVQASKSHQRNTSNHVESTVQTMDEQECQENGVAEGTEKHSKSCTGNKNMMKLRQRKKGMKVASDKGPTHIRFDNDDVEENVSRAQISSGKVVACYTEESDRSEVQMPSKRKRKNCRAELERDDDVVFYQNSEMLHSCHGKNSKNIVGEHHGRNENYVYDTGMRVILSPEVDKASYKRIRFYDNDSEISEKDDSTGDKQISATTIEDQPDRENASRSKIVVPLTEEYYQCEVSLPSKRKGKNPQTVLVQNEALSSKDNALLNEISELLESCHDDDSSSNVNDTYTNLSPGVDEASFSNLRHKEMCKKRNRKLALSNSKERLERRVENNATDDEISSDSTAEIGVNNVKKSYSAESREKARNNRDVSEKIFTDSPSSALASNIPNSDDNLKTLCCTKVSKNAEAHNPKTLRSLRSHPDESRNNSSQEHNNVNVPTSPDKLDRNISVVVNAEHVEHCVQTLFSSSLDSIDRTENGNGVQETDSTEPLTSTDETVVLVQCTQSRTCLGKSDSVSEKTRKREQQNHINKGNKVSRHKLGQESAIDIDSDLIEFSDLVENAEQPSVGREENSTSPTRSNSLQENLSHCSDTNSTLLLNSSFESPESDSDNSLIDTTSPRQVCSISSGKQLEKSVLPINSNEKFSVSPWRKAYKDYVEDHNGGSDKERPVSISPDIIESLLNTVTVSINEEISNAENCVPSDIIDENACNGLLTRNGKCFEAPSLGELIPDSYGSDSSVIRSPDLSVQLRDSVTPRQNHQRTGTRSCIKVTPSINLSRNLNKQVSTLPDASITKINDSTYRVLGATSNEDTSDKSCNLGSANSSTEVTSTSRSAPQAEQDYPCRRALDFGQIQGRARPILSPLITEEYLQQVDDRVVSSTNYTESIIVMPLAKLVVDQGCQTVLKSRDIEKLVPIISGTSINRNRASSNVRKRLSSLKRRPPLLKVLDPSPLDSSDDSAEQGKEECDRPPRNSTRYNLRSNLKTPRKYCA